MRYGGAGGQLTVRADSGFYAHSVVSVCRKMDVRFSITLRQHKSLHNVIEAIPEAAWTPFPTGWTAPPMWQRPPISPSRVSPTPRRCGLIVRRVKPTPGSQLALFDLQLSRLHHRPRWGDAGTGGRSSPSRRDRECDTHLKYGVGLNHMPSGRFAANGAWLAVQAMAHNLARWTARIGLGQQIVTTKTLRRRVFALAGRITRSARRLTLASSQALALGGAVQPRPGPAASHGTPSLTAPSATDPTSPQTRASPVRERLLPCPIPPSRSPQPL